MEQPPAISSCPSIRRHRIVKDFEAVRLGRRFLGFELKQSYATVAAKNLAWRNRSSGTGLSLCCRTDR